MVMNEPAVAFRPRLVSTSNAVSPPAPVDANTLHGAEQAYRRMLTVQPRHFRTLCGLAMVRLQLGDIGDAEMLLGQAAEAADQVADAPLLLGQAFASLGDCCRRLGRHQDAIAHYRRALSIHPETSGVLLNLGGCHQAVAQLEPAIQAFHQALAQDPHLAEAHYNLGNIYLEMNNWAAAVSHYERAIAERPGFPQAHNNLANALQKYGRQADAIAHYDEAIRIDPHYTAAFRNRADALRTVNRFDDAIASYRSALAIAPADAAMLNHLATTLSIVGRLDEASRAYEAALAIEPDNIGIQLNYAAIRRFVRDDPRLPRLQTLARRESTLSERERITLHFTLGRAYADIGDGERSLQHLHAGNALERRRFNYDETLALQQFERIRRIFTRELLEARSGRGVASDAPVFVIGMPRSGTSLIEQILASHPRVHGAGEVNHLAAAVASLTERRRGDYPEMLADLTDDELRALGNTYLDHLSGVSADRIVDKMPANFLFAGLIHILFPNAKIIHVKRNPIDTCLSCYSLLFAEPQPFAYDLGELGRYYNAYDALMRHWRSVLPEGVMLEVTYEDVVRDFDLQARRMIAHCGLDWDQRCLSFHETKRPVNTASLVQVRQPLFTDSVGRWRIYGERLKPLLEALGTDAVLGAVATIMGSTAPRATPANLVPPVVAPPAARSLPIDAPAEQNTLGAEAERAFAVAKKLQDRGDHQDAQALFSFILAAQPNHFGALVGLGVISTHANRLDEARNYFMRAVAINGRSAEAHGSIGAVEATAGRLDAAVGHYLRALALAPDHPGILYAYATALQSQGKREEAMAALQRAIAKKPQHLDAHFALGNLLYAAGKDIEAARCYVKVLDYSPEHAETHNNLANVLLRQGHPERGIEHYKKAIASRPDYADAYGNLGNALLELNRLEESIEQNLKALALKPERFGSYNNLGVAYQALGRFEEATAAFERAVELSPDEAPIHLNLANMSKFKPEDRRLPGLRRLLERVDQLDEEKQIAAHFAMGKALADLKDYDVGFQHLLKGNALKRATFEYDEKQRLAAMKNIAAKFTPEVFRACRGHGDTSWSPIFIVGMPRSGTTLMEQVLASHSQVFGAGELETFKTLIGEASKRRRVVPNYPELISSLPPEEITELGRMYTAQVRALAPDAARIVDKMPLNFMFVGLIHLALPNAKIIHIKRDPLDTCVSCFSLLFTGSQPFAYDLAELGRYYRGYEGVMAHWHDVLPPDVMIDVQYEDLVDDLEGVSRRMLAHCGLAWEDACRDFQNTDRAVRTASLMQVREPLYRRAVGSWRRYEKFLGPLQEALGTAPDADLRGN
jgi:tetratricopeptide (TPR) repeat protein